MDPHIIGAVLTFGFRPKRPGESDAAYRAAVIDHVEGRDMARGHELRIGKPQAQWTKAETEAFIARCRALPGPRDHFKPGRQQEFEIAETGSYAVTEASLVELAQSLLQTMIEHRQAKASYRGPDAAVPIIANVLLFDGRLWTTSVDRGDRVALLRMLASREPVFGFFVGFDAFMHAIDRRTGAARKIDTLLVQVGTRDHRWMLQRPYRFEGRAVVFGCGPTARLRFARGWRLAG